MSRNIADSLLTTTKNLPAAGAGNYHDALDLEQPTRGAVEAIELQVSSPALPALAEGKKLTFAVQDSADNTVYADVGISAVVTGGTGGGAPAQSLRFALPSTCRRYVRVSQAVEVLGGDNTAVTVTAQLMC